MYLLDNTIWTDLSRCTDRPGQTWMQYASDKFGGRDFRTTDGRLCAKVYWYNGINYMRICYASFVSKNGLWRYDSRLPSRPSQKPKVKGNQPPSQKDLLPPVEEAAN
jgi:hypothetical protein